jgi:glutamate N-acetyltransferase / amino-acid N-acetyltransferase
VTLPAGFLYSSAYAGIRKKGKTAKTAKDDLSLIVSQTPATTAAVFTKNLVQAAPVRLSRAHLKASKGLASAVLINAGNANCATKTGDAVALASARALAKTLGFPVNQIQVASTGVIGVELDAGLITKALPKVTGTLRMDAFEQVASAIMTTDLVPKTATAELSSGKGVIRMAGMTKGSGMIMPNMATTLGFVMTDAKISAASLGKILRAATEVSFNRISVDGDTSTNDTLLVMANGVSGVAVDKKLEPLFAEALTKLLQDLAIQIARDGEGAKKLVTINVTGAKSNDDAAKIARGIANSPLVKTAIHGCDPNWGRVLSAAGNAGAAFDPTKANIAMQGIAVCRNGLAAAFSEADLKKKLNSRDVTIEFLIQGKGTGQSRFWTCELSEGYIKINGSYRT